MINLLPFNLRYLDLSVLCPSITEWRESIIETVVSFAIMDKDVEYTFDQPDLCLGKFDHMS